MANNLAVKDGEGSLKTVRTDESAGVHTPVHRVSGSALPDGAATSAKQDSILTALALLATAAKQDAIIAAVDGVEGKLDTVIAAVELARPGNGGAAVTPADGSDLASPARAIFVGTGGDVSVVSNGNTLTFTNVQDGTLLPIRATRVRSTGTTATNIVAIY